MTDDQRRRLNTLADELSNLDGFVHMGDWMTVPHRDSLDRSNLRRAAQANPCGTAACIAGKAGLMEVFREEGFEWDFKDWGFTIPPLDFFGVEAYVAVFCGKWAMQHIHTPQQAALVLRDFLAQEAQGALPAELSSVTYTSMSPATYAMWSPSEPVQQAVEACPPPQKNFPVSGWCYAPKPRLPGERQFWERLALPVK